MACRTLSARFKIGADLKTTNICKWRGKLSFQSVIEPSHEKTNNLGFRPDPTQIGLYRHRILRNFGFKKKRDCTPQHICAMTVVGFLMQWLK